jgi:hypothetical protein
MVFSSRSTVSASTGGRTVPVEYSVLEEYSSSPAKEAMIMKDVLTSTVGAVNVAVIIPELFVVELDGAIEPIVVLKVTVLSGIGAPSSMVSRIVSDTFSSGLASNTSGEITIDVETLAVAAVETVPKELAWLLE